MNKKSDTVNSELRGKLFIVLALTGCISNIAGFTANAVIFGFTPQTLFCAACALVIIVSSLVGFFTGRTYVATFIILLVLGFVEFPMLYISYGASTAVYMLVAEIGIITFMKPMHRVIMGAAVFVADIAAFIVRSKFPHLNMANDNMELDTLFSFVIAFIGIMVAVAIVIVQFERQAKQLSEMGEELTLAVNTDPLTEIRNRRYLIEYLENQLSQDEKKKHCAVLIDLDLFKSVNDTYGHADGDIAISTVGQALAQESSASATCARFGGDEFVAAWACNSSSSEEEAAFRKRIQNYLDEFNASSGKPYTISSSLGIVVAVPSEDITLDEFIKVTDEKMYEEKVKYHQTHKR